MSKTFEAPQLKLRAQYDFFQAQCMNAPRINELDQFIGIDNRQRSEYDLREIRSELPGLPLVQVVGDSGTAFDVDKLAAIRALIAEYTANYMIEYGYTGARYDTNWFVAEYLGLHLDVTSIANIVHQSLDALEAGWEGYEYISIYLILFDRLAPTRFGDDVWLSDGIMFRELGDRMLCLEGGPQALYQCTSALTRGIQVVAVFNLRGATFSAARMLVTWHDPEAYLSTIEASEKQRNVVKWCSSLLRESGQDIQSLIIAVEVT